MTSWSSQVNHTVHRPSTVAEAQDLVRQHRRILPIGSRTKSALSFQDPTSIDTPIQYLSTRRLCGIVRYDPCEETVTAQAGTSVQELVSELAFHDQALPFDPILIHQRSTIGGTIASGLSGSGQYRAGDLRESLLGVKFISGDGELCVGGGDFVNSGGFDVSKLLVGSLGRLGLITEVTLSVVPKPVMTQSLLVQCTDHTQAAQRMQRAAMEPWGMDAIDYRPSERAIYLRLKGAQADCSTIVQRIENELGSDVTEASRTSRIWNSLSSLDWCPSSIAIARVSANLPASLQLQTQIDQDPELHSHWTHAGGVAWVAAQSSASIDRLDHHCSQLRLSGFVFIGKGVPMLIGQRQPIAFWHRIAKAMDPKQTFLPFPEPT